MLVSVQVSVYPLRQEHLSPAIDAMAEALGERGLEPAVGPMSTVARGEIDAIFAALRAGFERVARDGDVVMAVTVSNACPS